MFGPTNLDKFFIANNVSEKLIGLPGKVKLTISEKTILKKLLRQKLGSVQKYARAWK
jgi:hypothetical protein